SRSLNLNGGMQVMSHLDLATLSQPECLDSERVSRARISLYHDLGCPADPGTGVFGFPQGRNEPDGGQKDRSNRRPVMDMQPGKVNQLGLRHGRCPSPAAVFISRWHCKRSIASDGDGVPPDPWRPRTTWTGPSTAHRGG